MQNSIDLSSNVPSFKHILKMKLLTNEFTFPELTHFITLYNGLTVSPAITLTVYSQTSFIRTAWYPLCVQIVKHVDY